MPWFRLRKEQWGNLDQVTYVEFVDGKPHLTLACGKQVDSDADSGPELLAALKKARVEAAEQK